MDKLDVLNIQGQKINEVDINEELKNIKVSVPLLHEVVKAYLSNQRKGTSSTKTRAEVRGGGKKPWRQKGTGRARAGSIRSPLWRHGGVIFGPKPRNYRINIPKKKKRLSLKMAIKSKIDTNNVIIVDNFKIEEPKTKNIIQILKQLNLDNNKKILFITETLDKNLKLSSRNLKYFNILHINSLNTYDILNSDKIIFTLNAYNKTFNYTNNINE